MLTYEQAIKRIRKIIPPPRVEVVRLHEALGGVLARSIVAGCDLPPFDNSAVDGYALRWRDVQRSPAGTADRTAWAVAGTAAAGRPFRAAVRRGETVRILTGAPVPMGADTVVMQEQVVRHHQGILLQRQPQRGQHIRRRGEDLRRGTTVLRAGTRLRPQDLGLLAALGLARVPVYRRPSVAIVITGDELRPPGMPLQPGQIYESNGVMLRALVQRVGADVRSLGHVRDTVSHLTAKIRQGFTCDVLLLSGGVSVGERDFVRRAARECGVTPIVWQVNIKPGMPLFVGRRGRTLVFGLPGNPVSVFVTFEEFVKPVLCRLLGRPWRDGYATPATLATDVRVSTTRRTHFVRVRCLGDGDRLQVEPLEGQGSHRLLSLTQADGWIRLVADQGRVPAGTPVSVKRWTDG